jgi:ornithine cyclodeaminase/alanine dehydrogenase-like protein (mu-crystallin family)
VDTPEALHEAGDIVQPLHDGIIARSDILLTLADLARMNTTARKSETEITCFKAVGSGLADLVAAKCVAGQLGL